MQAIEMVIEKGMNNGPFYSCVLTYLAMNASEAGGNCALLQTCFSHVNANSLAEVQLDLHNNSSKVCIKQGHLQPRCHSKATSQSRQL